MVKTLANTMQVIFRLIWALHLGQYFMTAVSGTTESIPPANQNDNENDGDPLSTRIVGGTITSNDGIPYQLHWSYKRDIACGATLVEVYAIQIAITATHCLWTGYPDSQSVKNARYITVNGGDRRLSDYSSKEQERNVTKVVAHPDYDPKFFTHDIAILFLNRNFRSTQWVQPVRLPEHNWDTPARVNVSGWGSRILGDGMQNELQWADQPTVDDFTCHKFNQIPWIDITSNMFCVGEIGVRYLKGTCSGDSGGPAVAYNNSELYLAGVISFGITPICGNPFFPTVFTRVSKYVDWIRIEVSKYREENNL